MASIYKKIKNNFQVFTSWMSFGSEMKDDNYPTRQDNAHRPDAYVMPFQMQRLRQDAKSWKDAVVEAENAWWMHRVKMQQMYLDTILNGHIDACMRKRRNLVLLKEFELVNGETPNEEATKLLQADWFNKLINYILDAQAFGYSLIGLGDLVNNEFPTLKLVRRWNVSPDRLNLTSIVYSLNGLNFTDPEVKDSDGISFYDWSIWVETPNEVGPSRCGYGYLYKVALYEVYLRSLLGFNADYCEMFGQPMRWLKTDAQKEERNKQEQALQNMGSSFYLMTGMDADLQIIEPKNGGEGYKSYANFEERLEKKITKIILGHADAMDSIPGKLGNQNGKDNPIHEALDDVETTDCKFVEHVMNSEVIPKLLKIGFPIQTGLKFRYKNNAEIEEIKTKENKIYKEVADFVKTLKDAGLEVQPEWITERTGIPLNKTEIEPINNEIPTDKVKNFYAKAAVR